MWTILNHEGNGSVGEMFGVFNDVDEAIEAIMGLLDMEEITEESINECWDKIYIIDRHYDAGTVLRQVNEEHFGDLVSEEEARVEEYLRETLEDMSDGEKVYCYGVEVEYKGEEEEGE